MKAWEEGKIGIPDDGHPGQLSSRAIEHQAWMRADTITYEIEYEEARPTPQHHACASVSVSRICSAFQIH